jgi:hypothetical protein
MLPGSGKLGESGYAERELKRRWRGTTTEFQIERRGHETKLRRFDGVAPRRKSGKLKFA